MLTNPKATIEDLYHVSENGKAELVDGELIRMAPTGFLPSRPQARYTCVCENMSVICKQDMRLRITRAS